MGPRGRRLTTALLWCGVIAGPLFVAVFLLEGLRSGYDPDTIAASG